RAIDAAAAAAGSGGLAVPDGVCPKCVTPKRPGAGDCAACGLEFSRFDPATVAPAPWLAESWAGVLAAWGDPGGHEKLLGRAQQEGELPALARLYRLRLAAEPNDAIARRGCDEVVRRALLPSALASETQGKSTGEVLRMAAMGLFFVITLVALVWMARLLLSEPF
ncbi:MAG: hypothetical protein K1X89_23250, partial [Myxococcaceae bacterium]|nr:hypothetical protein [Myxococcaceae bacterium]